MSEVRVLPLRPWAGSLIGKAPVLQAERCRFDPDLVHQNIADVVKLEDTPALEAEANRHVGSTPTIGTNGSEMAAYASTEGLSGNKGRVGQCSEPRRL